MPLYWNLDDMLDAGDGPDILAEGDSWFSYWLPDGGNLLDKLDAHYGGRYGILSLASPGDQAREMLRGQSREDLISYLSAFPMKIRVLLFSGGGNDITRDKMVQMLKRDCSAAFTADDCFRPGQPAARLGEIAAAYRELVRLRDRHAPRAAIVAHNYDYAIPNGNGALGGMGWLEPPMKLCKVPPHLRGDIVKVLIDGFERILAPMVDAGFRFVKTSGTLGPDDWANELHPTHAGNRKLALKFTPVMNPLLP